MGTVDIADRFERYSRQILLPQLGRHGQEKLAAARVGLVGCGALGSMIAIHLVRAGVGYLRVVDSDHAELHNLHRQLLYTEEDVKRRTPKAEAAAAHLREVNSEVAVEPVVARIDAESLPGFADDLDLVVDGTDNFAARFAINDYAVRRGMPWVYGGVIGTSGMSMTIRPGEGPCLRCLVHEVPPAGQSPTADVAGVLNTVVAIVGSVEATEAIKLIVDPAACNRALLVLDVWDLVFDKLEVPRDPGCLCCGAGEAE
ncbi:MAG: HesA/MoeB/ThiF family protein [Thermoleophilia bacterium]|nr:HesA/MoeB/ThiF family protein [Thermoleophilia bacterium]